MSKVVSLAPNVTEVITELGSQEELLGTTSHSSVSEDLGGWLTPDYQRIRELNPEIVFTSDDLQSEVKSELETMGFNVIHYEPRRFSDVFELITDISQRIDRKEQGEKLKDRLTERVHKVKEHVQDKNRPVVYSEEWDSPPMAAGNWVPDMIRIAGGKYPFVEPGERSRCVNFEEYNSKNVEYFISHLCGQGLMSDFRGVRDESWDYPEETYFVNDDYMNQLSPNTVTGIEIIASIIHDYPTSAENHQKR